MIDGDGSATLPSGAGTAVPRRVPEGDPSALVGMFGRIAEAEFRGSSPVYAYLSEFLAGRPELAAPLLAAPPPQRRALLYFAAAQYVVRTREPDHPLAAYLPVLGGDRTPDAGLAVAFAALVATYQDELANLCAGRTTQTNEPARCALLRPALALATTAWAGPVALVDLGTSAGLLLIPDRYAYRYPTDSPGASCPDVSSPDRYPRARHPGASPGARVYGRPGAPPELTMSCLVRDAAPPADLLATTPRIGARIGIDLSPVAAGDTAATTWLRCCVWPEHTGRLRRLDAALAEAALVPRTLLAGDMVEILPAVLADLPSDVLPLITSSNSLTYLPAERRRRLVASLARAGAGRDLAVVVNEAASCGLNLFTDEGPVRAPGSAAGTLATVRWRAGRPQVDALATTGAHGAWMSWHPRGYPPAIQQ